MSKVAHDEDEIEASKMPLLEHLIERPVRRLVVASSMSIYGEGLYRTPKGEVVEGHDRTREQLRADRWELYRDGDDAPLEPVPTPETKSPTLASVYALSKYDQERMCLMIGRAYDIPTVALRFFNVYGTRQALSNPYTGVLAIFASRYLNGNPPLIFEDGYQRRDFVSVRDVAQACRLALETDEAAGQVFNVGSGRPRTVREIAERMGTVMGRGDLEPRITGEYRVGDIRHCFADISGQVGSLQHADVLPVEIIMNLIADTNHQQIMRRRAGIQYVIKERIAEAVALPHRQTVPVRIINIGQHIALCCFCISHHQTAPVQRIRRGVPAYACTEYKITRLQFPGNGYPADPGFVVARRTLIQRQHQPPPCRNHAAPFQFSGRINSVDSHQLQRHAVQVCRSRNNQAVKINFNAVTGRIRRNKYQTNIVCS